MLTAQEGGGTVRAMALLSCPGHGARRAPCGPCLLPVQMKVQGLRSELRMGFDHGGAGHCKRQLLQRGGPDLRGSVT